jgi:hypothetical protein
MRPTAPVGAQTPPPRIRAAPVEGIDSEVGIGLRFPHPCLLVIQVCEGGSKGITGQAMEGMKIRGMSQQVDGDCRIPAGLMLAIFHVS